MKHCIFVLILFLLLFHTSSVAQKRELLFMGSAMLNGKPIPMRFGISSRLPGGCFVGTNKRGVPSVSPSVSGRIVIPDSVTVPHDLVIDGRVIITSGTVLPVVCVSRRAFAGCRQLTDIILPPTLVYINDQAFRDCQSLTSITLPPLLKRIYPFAFSGCQRLTRVVAQSPFPPDAYNDIFESMTLRQATLVVPGQAAKTYRTAYLWNMFRYRFEDVYQSNKLQKGEEKGNKVNPKTNSLCKSGVIHFRPI